MKPIALKKTDARELTIEWDNGHVSRYSLELLRDRCPCAGCAGETVLFQSYQPPPPDKKAPGRYELKGATPVGSYAVQLEWGDGHMTGIYTWEHLLKICPCTEHAGA